MRTIFCWCWLSSHSQSEFDDKWKKSNSKRTDHARSQVVYFFNQNYKKLIVKKMLMNKKYFFKGPNKKRLDIDLMLTYKFGYGENCLNVFFFNILLEKAKKKKKTFAKICNHQEYYYYI